MLATKSVLSIKKRLTLLLRADERIRIKNVGYFVDNPSKTVQILRIILGLPNGQTTFNKIINAVRHCDGWVSFCHLPSLKLRQSRPQGCYPNSTFPLGSVEGFCPVQAEKDEKGMARLAIDFRACGGLGQKISRYFISTPFLRVWRRCFVPIFRPNRPLADRPPPSPQRRTMSEKGA